MTSPHRIAFIGLGAMGYPMAGHLARAGHDVTVFNRTTGRAAMPSRSDSTAGTSFASDDTRFSTVLTTNDMLLGSGGDCGGKVGGCGGLPLLLADSLRSRGAGWDG